MDYSSYISQLQQQLGSMGKNAVFTPRPLKWDSSQTSAPPNVYDVTIDGTAGGYVSPSDMSLFADPAAHANSLLTQVDNAKTFGENAGRPGAVASQGGYATADVGRGDWNNLPPGQTWQQAFSPQPSTVGAALLPGPRTDANPTPVAQTAQASNPFAGLSQAAPTTTATPTTAPAGANKIDPTTLLSMLAMFLRR